MSERQPERNYDLEERTAVFGEQIIKFLKCIRRNPINTPLITQLVRSATSIGANYCEGNDAESRKDFRHKMSLCRKESRESMYWLRQLSAAQPESVEEARKLWKEAKELNLIFSAIIRKVDNNDRTDEPPA
ncbi:MAG: four helix bundle protein [Pirellulaceae bacterium]